MTKPVTAPAVLAPGEVVQPTSVTALHSRERREVALLFGCATREPLTVVLPQMAAAEMIGMLTAELEKLDPLPDQPFGKVRHNN